MNKKQERTINLIKQEIPHFDFYSLENYEIKEFEIKEFENGSIYLWIETGLKDDEGTLASIYCRKKRSCIIGIKGGIKASKSISGNFRSVSRFTFMNECHWN